MPKPTKTVKSPTGPRTLTLPPGADEALLLKVAEDALHGERTIFEGLSASEQEIVVQWLAEALVTANPENPIHDVLWELDFHQKPVSIETFLDDPEYLGRVAFGRGEGDPTGAASGQGLHPRWLEDLKEVFRPGSPYMEWILSGAIGTGKTTAAMLALAYKVYWLSCLRNPWGYYGLMPGSLLVFGIYSITKRQVGETGYYKFRGWIDGSPYFRTHFPRSQRIDSKVVFTRRNVQVIPGCVAAGTRIATPSGWVPIEDLPRTGGEVLSGTDRVSQVRYSQVVEAGRRRCLDLVREDGKIVTVSAAHPVFTLRDGTPTPVPARDLRPGDLVLALRAGEAPERVLPLERAALMGLQALLPPVQPRSVSPDQDLSRQAEPPGGPVEAVPALPRDEAARGVSRPDHPASWRDEDVLAFLVQSLRVEGPAGLLPGTPYGAPSVGSEAAFHVGVETTRAEALAAILRHAPCCDLGTTVIARRPFRAESAVAYLEAEESRAGAGVPSCVDAAVPRESARACATLGEDPAGASGASRDGAAAGGPKAGLAGYAYAVGCRAGAGVLWRKMLLLWSRPLPANLDLGPCGPVEPGRWYDAEEYRARVSGLQQPQEQPHGRGVLSDSSARSSPCLSGSPAPESNPSLGVVRLVEVRDAGWQPCYDLVEAGPARAFFAGGLLVKNSQQLHAIGLDLHSVAIDEANFMRAKADREQGKMIGQAYELYNATHARITSRFLRPGGTIPGIMLLMSSKNAQTSFLEDLLKQRREAGMSRTYVSDYALWDVKPKHRYVLPWFRVEVGDRFARSRILVDDNLTLLREFHAGRLPLPEAQRRGKPVEDAGGSPPRPGATVVPVPGEFLRVFEEDVDQALREHAGKATFNVSPLIRDRASITDAIRADIPNPFTREEVTLSAADEVLLEDYFKIDTAARIVESNWIPRFNPTLPRFVHVDLGLTGDCAGFAMGHISGIKQVERVNADGTRSAIENPFIVMDLLLRIRPPPGSEIDFSKIRAFLGYLKRIYRIVKVTLDGWQSIDFVQIVQKPPLLLEAAVQSIDRTDQPYISLRSAHFDRRIAMYHYQPYIDEVLDLQRVKRANSEQWKVDHPEKATRGGKGCLAGSTKVCLLDGRRVPLRDLVRQSDGQPIYVYTIRDGAVSVGVARNPRLTRRRARTVLVTLDNQHTVCCTPDHRFLLRDGTYREAARLRFGDSLMPLYTQVPTKRRDGLRGYELYRCPSDGRWHFTHRMVGRWKYGSRYTGNQFGEGVIHHSRGKLNNDPRALLLVDRQEHGQQHADDMRARRADPAFERKRRRRAVRYARSLEGRTRSRENMLALNRDPDFAVARDVRARELGRRTGTANITRYNKSAQHRRVAARTGRRTIWYAIAASRGPRPQWRGNLNPYARRDVTLRRIAEVMRQGDLSRAYGMQVRTLRELGCTQKVITRILRENGHTWATFVDAVRYENHRVRSVRPGPVTDVYDLTVEGTENFALDAGVFVHNSKDVSDCAAGVVHGLLSDIRFGRAVPIVDPEVRASASPTATVVDPAQRPVQPAAVRRMGGLDVDFEALRGNLRRP